MLNDKDFKKVFHIPNYSLFEKDIKLYHDIIKEGLKSKKKTEQD
jgi:hypothetical protein